MISKNQDYKPLLAFGAAFWAFFAFAGIAGNIHAFADLDTSIFYGVLAASTALLFYATHKRSRYEGVVSIIGGMVLLAAALSVHVFEHVRSLESTQHCSVDNPDACLRASNYFRDYSLIGGYSDVIHFRLKYENYKREQQRKADDQHNEVVFSSSVYHQDAQKTAIKTGQLYTSCLFGDRQTMINKMKKREAFTWFFYSKFGSPQDIFGGFRQGRRTKYSCETLIETGILENQEVGCTGLRELCEVQKSDRCEVRRKQCDTILSSPFE